ncbi:hypothetical protein [Marinigracilibium pacificum]|uniref:LTXXQ motif family protein n=1 Tax=Marinigracilibium pacificum TaxID=2729599 RepID=A0A848IZU8_9BACT|nr:hypothetical protein [Marinigracilibium pacificum]NMM47519.1 hypothetical protein [Marinigracilibium pacificum]
MRKIVYSTLFVLMLSSLTAINAQRPDVSKRIQEELVEVKNTVSDLNPDQILILDQIYQEFESSIKSTIQERNREKMMAIRDEKDEAIKDLFTQEQYAQYQEFLENRRKNSPRGNRQKENHEN